MSNRLTFILALAARLTTIGSIKATVPVLLTKAPINAVTSMTSKNSLSSLSPAKFIILPLIFLARPVWNIAPPTTNNPTIMITTGLEKPDKASAGDNMPNIINANRAHRATRSERTLPIAKNTAATRRTIIVVTIMKLFIDDYYMS